MKKENNYPSKYDMPLKNEEKNTYNNMNNRMYREDMINTLNSNDEHFDDMKNEMETLQKKINGLEYKLCKI
jgi:hypothetical protein